MLDIMQSVLLILIEIMCCKIFYELFEEVRYKGWINIMQFGLLFGSMYFLAYGHSKHFTIRQIAVILMFSIFMLWHVKLSLKKSVVLAILFDALLLAMDYPIYLISRWIPLNRELIGQPYDIGRIIIYLPEKLILFILIIFIRKRFKKKITGKNVGYRMAKIFVFPPFYHSVNFSNAVCFWICTDSKAGKLPGSYCIWFGGNEYCCVLFNLQYC